MSNDREAGGIWAYALRQQDPDVTLVASADELLARVRSILRRVEFSELEERRPPFEAGDLRIDFDRRRVYVGDREVHLTSKEYHLLCELVEHAGQVPIPDYLLERVWGLGYEGENLLV